MSSLIDFSKEEMLEDLTFLLQTFVEGYSSIFSGLRTGLNLFGVDLNLNSKNITPDEKNILNFHIGLTMAEVYDYAVNGILPDSFEDDHEWSFIMEDFFPVIEEICSSEFLEYFGGNNFSRTSRCKKIIDLTHARLCLDYGVADTDNEKYKNGYIQIPHLAALSGLDERTIRNMTSSSHNSYIETEKIGNRTYIKVEIAKEWLSKRGFKQTVKVNKNIDRDLEKNGFLTRVDLAYFIESNAENRRINKNEEGKYQFSNCEISNYVHELISLKNGSNFSFNFEFLLEVAKELYIDKSKFVAACFKLYQRDEMDNMLNKIRRTID